MNFRIFAAISGLIATAVATPSAAAAKYDKSDLGPFKSSYSGTLLVSVAGGGSAAGIPATISFTPAKSGKSAIVSLSAPFNDGGTSYNFGGVISLSKNKTSTTSDVLLGFSPAMSYPTTGFYTRTGQNSLSLTESVTLGGTTVILNGTFQISKMGKKNQQLVANFTVVSQGTLIYTLQFTAVGKAPKLKP